MRKSKLQAANLEGDADDIEAAFYDALQRGDIDRLMACWADEDEIICIHPGGPRVVGATAIRATFEAMFADGGTVRAAKVADLLAVLLRLAPPGIHVAAPELVWQAAQQDASAVVRRWLG